MSDTQICHINVARGFRGGERQTELLIRELAKRRVSQALICRRSQPLVSRLADIDIEIREVSGNPLAVAMRAGQAQLLHVHEGRSVYAAYLRHLFSGTPYVITRRVTNAIKDHRFAHSAYRRAARVAAISPQVESIVRSFDSAIDVTVVFSASSGLPFRESVVAELRDRWNGKFVVGHVGALDMQKGQKTIIEAARRCAISHPELHFVLVGGGDDEQHLRQLAVDLQNLEFTGFVDNVGDFLAAFDLFILPSNREGLGSILFDAMERKLAIVASRVGGVPSIVHDNHNGLLIDPGRPDQLRAAIVRLYEDPELRHDFGEAGARIAAANTPAAMCGKYLEIYAAVLGRALGAAEVAS